METGIVSTIGQKCKRCYSCVRECPARAIRVLNGQAVVLQERCISCGYCVKVCSQNAKKIQSDIEKVLYDYLPMGNAVAIIAPSFPAAFPDNSDKLPASLRAIGFSKVCEVSFGADLISDIYRKHLESSSDKTIISSPCPAIYNLIEKYYSGMVDHLADIVSPMVAMGRYLKKNLGNDVKVVFIGPCVAKKSEYIENEVADAIDAVLTFKELKEIFSELNIDINDFEESELDPPHAFLGKSFPLTGGLLKTANISGDILAKDIIVVEGKEKAIEVIKGIADNRITSKFVDILFCEGCINGPGIDTNLNYYSKREKVINYVEKNLSSLDKNVWKSEIYNSRDLELRRSFVPKNQRRPMPAEDEIRRILEKTNKFTESDELNCGACGYPSCREYAVHIAKGLAEDDMCLPYLIDKLEAANEELKTAHEQLQSAEKLASIGQLAAGVAHEINNPLGTIMLYASMLKKQVDNKSCSERNAEDLKLIIDEANRCKHIVANLLNFARQGKLKISEINISGLINSIIQVIKMDPKCNNMFINFNDTTNDCTLEGDADQIKQILINIINNACESLEFCDVKNVTINTQVVDDSVVIDIIDTGCGISEENMNKLFTPFFTTKKIGKGTGLGLAISYGIIKMHRGDIKVKSTVGKGTAFTIKLPRKFQIHNTVMN